MRRPDIQQLRAPPNARPVQGRRTLLGGVIHLAFRALQEELHYVSCAQWESYFA
jgi:hypothetical protein